MQRRAELVGLDILEAAAEAADRRARASNDHSGRRHRGHSSPAPQPDAALTGAAPASPPSRCSRTKNSSASGFASASRLTAVAGSWPMRMRLTGTSSTLPESVRGTASICRITSGTWRGEQSSRSARADRRDQLVRQLETRSQDDEERHERVRAVERQVDDERVDDLVEREHRAVDLGRAHAHAAAVDRRVGAAADDGRAALRDLDPVAVAPDPRIGLEVALAVAPPVRVVPEVERHRRHRLGQRRARRPAPVSGRPCSSQASTLQPSERACSSPRYTGSVGTPPTNGVQTSVPPEVENSQMSAPTCSETQSNPDGDSGEPVEPMLVRADRSRPRAGSTPALRQAPMYAALAPKHVMPVFSARSQSASHVGRRGASVVEHDRGPREQPADEEVPHHPAGGREPEHAVARLQVDVQGQLLRELEQDAAVAMHDRLRQPRRAGAVEHPQGMVERQLLEGQRAGATRVPGDRAHDSGVAQARRGRVPVSR